MQIILHDHATHTENIEVIRLGREYGIVMLCFPAHKVFKLRRLDTAFFQSLNVNFNNDQAFIAK